MKIRYNLIFLLIICLNFNIGKAQNNTIQKTLNDSFNHWGVWYNPEFIDSSIIKKTIYKNASFLTYWIYSISFNKDNPDSCIINGTHFGKIILPLSKLGENHFQTKGDYPKIDVSFFKYKNKDFLKLKMEKDYPKSAVHYFKKTDSNINDVQQFFIQKIIAGKYYDAKHKKTITFNTNQTVDGLDSLKFFELGLGNCDHEPEMDFIKLAVTDSSLRLFGDVWYNWQFKNNHLILREIIVKDSEERWFDTFKGKIKYDLIKIK
jgi:hypothetical protein